MQSASPACLLYGPGFDEDEQDAINACAPKACSFAVQHCTVRKCVKPTTTPKKGKDAATIETPEKKAAAKVARMEAARAKRWDAAKKS